MRRWPWLLAALVLCVGGCGDDGSPGTGRSPGGLSLSLRHPEPLRSGAVVTWTLVVRNPGPEPVVLSLSSGQSGDVVLRQDGGERYRWSQGRVYTQVFREVRLAEGESRSFPLEGSTLEVAPGVYELEASLAGQPAPTPVRESVTVVA